MATCKSCGAEIEWIITPSGAAHPVDVKPEKRWVLIPMTGPLDELNDHEHLICEWKLLNTFLSHFATCPQSKAWSGKGKKP